MSAIKDLVDLSTQLSQSITDKKILNVVIPFQQKALAAERENAALEAKLFDTNRQHAEEMAALKTHYEQVIADLNTKNAKLIATIEQLQSPDQQLALDETKTAILVFLGDGHDRLSYEIADHLKISEQLAHFHLHELADMTPSLIYYSSNSSRGVPNQYSINQDGRRYLVQHGLLK